MTAGVFAMIYKIMPRVQVRWHDVWLGAVVTAALFTVGKFLIGLYIGKSGVASGFGAAGSLVVIFIWVYYSAQIFLMGAEFTWVYARTFGSMRSLSESAKEARESDLPSRSRGCAGVGGGAGGGGSGAAAHRGAATEEDGTGLAQRRHRPGGGGGASLPRAAAAAPALSVARSGEAASLPVHQCDHAAGGNRHREHLLQSRALMITLAVLAIGIPARHCRLARRVKPCSHRVPAG